MANIYLPIYIYHGSSQENLIRNNSYNNSKENLTHNNSYYKSNK